MIQPELERSTQGYPLVSVEVRKTHTQARNPVNEILLKLNLPDHRILKDGGEGRVSSTNASESKLRGNTKNDKILQPSSRSMKNKVEAHHMKFKSSANKNNHVSDCKANV
uniref:Uncharacterized protein n=1 Tax=Tanacetum cinerariifolium TaxID=118510 RepID=A0A6L2NNI4_TANCI|nr:hypothetical protein [Tanacetum cinerariifolium]GEV07879.1 hypothetical protein [Tanacetum cinerariifolium]